MMRIVIIGTTGAGKTTLARKIGQKLGIPHQELDYFQWDKNWTHKPDAVFRQLADDWTKQKDWIVDGNYSRLRDLIWKRAELIIWLDYPFWLNFKRILGRTLYRCWTKKPFWHGNVGHFRKQFFHSDSIIRWFFKTYPKNKKRYPRLFVNPPYPHLKMLRLTSPKMTEIWFAALKKE